MEEKEFLWQIVSLYQEKEKLNKEIQDLKELIRALEAELVLVKESKIVTIPYSLLPYSPIPGWPAPMYPQSPIYGTPIITCSDNGDKYSTIEPYRDEEEWKKHNIEMLNKSKGCTFDE